MTDQSREIEVRPCVAADGRRTSWDICEGPEPGAKGAVVIASCFGSLEQAERMAAALRGHRGGQP